MNLLSFFLSFFAISLLFFSLHASLLLAAVLAHPARRLAAVDVDGALLLLLGLLGVDDALLDVRGEGEEGLFHVDVGLGADLHEGDAELVGERLALLRRHRALLLPVAFVADEDLVDALGGVLLDVGKPGADVCGRGRKRKR